MLNKIKDLPYSQPRIQPDFSWLFCKVQKTSCIQYSARKNQCLKGQIIKPQRLIFEQVKFFYSGQMFMTFKFFLQPPETSRLQLGLPFKTSCCPLIRGRKGRSYPFLQQPVGGDLPFPQFVRPSCSQTYQKGLP